VPVVQMKNEQMPWIRMKIAGIVLLPVGGAITAWSLLFFSIFSICMHEGESADLYCTGPPYKLLILTGAGVELMLIGALLLGIGHSYLKRTAEASHPRPWPFVALVPCPSPGGVMASLSWRL
jgi:hypothetical protein